MVRPALVVLTISLAAACGSREPSKLEQERAKAQAACTKGEATQCFIAASALDPTKQDELRRAMDLWARNCELDHGASCAQLGTVAELGMTSGGAKPDPVGAMRYYARACERGDAESCKRAGMPLPEGITDPTVKIFPWREALTPICGKGHGELGPLFDGLVPGEPMPEPMKQQVAAFEKKFKARVHYYPGIRRSCRAGRSMCGLRRRPASRRSSSQGGASPTCRSARGPATRPT